MIEEKTTYAYKLKYQEDLSFDKIMSFTRINRTFDKLFLNHNFHLTKTPILMIYI